MPSAKVMRIPVDKMEYFMSDIGQPNMSFSDTVFGFLGEGESGQSSMSPISEDTSESLNVSLDDEDDGGGKENNVNHEKDKNFWENQHRVLQATLCRTSPLESRIRNVTKEAIKELQTAGTMCGCGRPMAGGCRYCLMDEISGRLRNSGFDSAICKSKWRNSPDIPSGEHTFLDVIDNSSTIKGEIRVIIEPNFRGEFEMAKASEEYNQLVGGLPEVFVGKVERLQEVIKILCSAAKKCMKEKKMHLGPWRRQRYMQAKWLGACKRTTSVPTLAMEVSNRLPKPRASMLTADLLDMVPNFRRAAVTVL